MFVIPRFSCRKQQMASLAKDIYQHSSLTGWLQKMDCNIWLITRTQAKWRSQMKWSKRFIWPHGNWKWTMSSRRRPTIWSRTWRRKLALKYVRCPVSVGTRVLFRPSIASFWKKYEKSIPNCLYNLKKIKSNFLKFQSFFFLNLCPF